MIHFKIVKVNADYCDYLRQFDFRVPYNRGVKDLRPFIGILFVVDGLEYFAPLSSPKPKHLTITNKVDLVKIKGGSYGVINFNNMIPVTKNSYELFDLDSKPTTIAEQNRQNLLKSQLHWLNNHFRMIEGKARRLYDAYKKDILTYNIKNRCCNFPLLEEKSKIYKEKKVNA